MRYSYCLLAILLIMIGCSPSFYEDIRYKEFQVIIDEAITGEAPYYLSLTPIISGGKQPYHVSWAFEEGIIIGENFAKTFDKSGNYSIILNVTDSIGNKFTKAISISIAKKRIKIKKYAALGDSLTYGKGSSDPPTKSFPAILKKRLVKDAEVFNLAKPGSKILNVSDSQLPELEEINPDFVTLWIGSNDVINLINIDQFSQQYDRLLDELTTITNSTLLIINIPDFTETEFSQIMEENIQKKLKAFDVNIDLKALARQYLSNYNDAIEEHAKDKHILVYNIFSEAIDADLISDDGFHPNDRGYEKVADDLINYLQEAFPDKEFR